MSFVPAPGSLDQAGKDSSRPFLLPAQLLWVALDPKHELATVELHAFHQAIWRMRHGHQGMARVADCLVVEAVDSQMRFAEGAGEQRAGLDVEPVDEQVARFAVVILMGGAFYVHVLPQRAFARHVEDLYAAAYPEHREPIRDRPTSQCQLHLVQLWHEREVAVIARDRAVTARLDVGAAGQKQAVEELVIEPQVAGVACDRDG